MSGLNGRLRKLDDRFGLAGESWSQLHLRALREDERRQAEEAIETLNASGDYPDPVVTAIEPAKLLLEALSDSEHASATLRLAWIGAFAPDAPSHHPADDNVALYLRAVEERLHSEASANWPFTVTSEVIAEQDLPQAVAELASQKQATFLALAPHGKRGYPLHTSADFDVRLRGATALPLLIVPRNAAREKA